MVDLIDSRRSSLKVAAYISDLLALDHRSEDTTAWALVHVHSPPPALDCGHSALTLVIFQDDTVNKQCHLLTNCSALTPQLPCSKDHSLEL